MANRVYLMNHHQSEPALAAELEEACLLAASYQLPILWLALFDSDDLTNVLVHCENDAGEEVSELVLTCFASTEKALKTYSSRRQNLQVALGVDSAVSLSEWDAFMTSQLQAPVVQIDLTELWMMYGDAYALDSQFSEWLTGLDDTTSAAWASFCEQANLSDADTCRYGVRGYPWNATLEWQ
ncbi:MULTISPECIES: hypothetical protein [Pseudomonas syringae group]|uniref:Uncharacterized protein n=3 Tax=Pseudomonas syringae group TaxID=136849 RepID=A0A2S4I8U5_PSEA0|nr:MULTISPECIES: hypothetical protein [Pseudomonas syringae group]EGH11940.1 hypothetical protein PSYMP_19229 [Pseudomonas amygdali pv. morsprunorum str. M302280]KWS56294.1 hypothetical protein AL055_07190 [Pseudomonas amygdali pv. morsprunorum]PHN41608.1 hypothetical protein AO261_28430 [Pseudomonas avellanae]POC88575.1 hypothetical protein BKM26_18830 [Pseudomonas avellanae]POD06320.1 hypothetical protein BKM20_18640 [Pseudomonas avellanae]